MASELRELALFAGAGGGILGGHLLGWRTVCAVEWAKCPREVLLARQRDGLLPSFPIWDDVQTFDGIPWRGRIDVVSGGFPCQDISAAGKGAGITGKRSGMWGHMARIIGEVRPRFVLVENSPLLTLRGLGTVLGDLAAMGYDAEWGVLGAGDLGAPHQRDRIWIVARDTDRPIKHKGTVQGISWSREQTPNPGGVHPEMADSHGADSHGIHEREQQRHMEADATRGGPNGSGGAPSTDHGGRVSGTREEGRNAEVADTQGETSLRREREFCEDTGRGEGRDAFPGGSPGNGEWWAAEPDVGRVAHGVARRLDRLKAIGNGQVSVVAAFAFVHLAKRAGWLPKDYLAPLDNSVPTP